MAVLLLCVSRCSSKTLLGIVARQNIASELDLPGQERSRAGENILERNAKGALGLALPRGNEEVRHFQSTWRTVLFFPSKVTLFLHWCIVVYDFGIGPEHLNKADVNISSQYFFHSDNFVTSKANTARVVMFTTL